MNPMERKRVFREPFALPTPALFLDRDGVLIEDRHHLSDPAHVALCRGAYQLLQEARTHGWPVVVITNQSGIARGYFQWDSYEQVTDRLLELLGPVPQSLLFMPTVTGRMHHQTAGANPALECCGKPRRI